MTHHGAHYTVENARLYTRPETPPQILMSGFAPKSTDLAARIADGYITTKADADLLDRFRGAAKDGATAQVGFKVAWAPSEDEGVSLAHTIWPNVGLPGELSQVLPTPEHFEQAATLVTEEQTRESVTAGDDPARHIQAFTPFLEAGFDEVYVANMGPHWAEMLRVFGSEVLPELRSRGGNGTR